MPAPARLYSEELDTVLQKAHTTASIIDNSEELALADSEEMVVDCSEELVRVLDLSRATKKLFGSTNRSKAQACRGLPS